MASPVQHSLVKALQIVPVFGSFDDRTLVRIVGASANLFWRAGGVVFKTGSEAEALYIVLSGAVSIVDPAHGDREIARIGPGEFFGELSLLYEGVHSKNAVAAEDSELMVLPKDQFCELLDENAELAAAFHGKADERRAANEKASTGG
jgi:CRP/FNR family cyclic AMP-dependent transcriptional regulator